MANIYFHEFLLKISKQKKGTALDLACGKSHYSNILSKNGWYVDRVDIKKDLKFHNHSNKEKFHHINLCTFNHNLNFRKLLSKKYNLILILKYTNRLLMNTLPLFLKKNGYIFFENFMIHEKFINRDYKLNKFEINSLFKRKTKKVKFFQGEINGRRKIQSGVFQKRIH